MNSINIINTVTFGEALEALKVGRSIKRVGWNGKDMYVRLQRPDDFSFMSHPYMFIEYPANEDHPVYPNGSRIPWVPSQSDALAEDWIIIGDE